MERIQPQKCQSTSAFNHSIFIWSNLIFIIFSTHLNELCTWDIRVFGGGEKKGTYAGVSSLPPASSSRELTFSRPPGDNMLTHIHVLTHTSRKAERLRRTKELVNIC